MYLEESPVVQYWPEKEFIAKAQAVHGKTRYDYSRVRYTRNTVKVEIGCIRCMNTFWQMASVHLSGGGCPECKGIACGNRCRGNTTEFIRKAMEMHEEGRYDYSSVVYTGSLQKVIIKCNECGSEFKQNPSDHLSGYGCRDCGHVAAGNQHRSNTQKFIARAMKTHGNIRYDYSLVEYIDMKTRVTIICNQCGTTFTQIAGGHASGLGCKTCGNANKGAARRSDAQEFVRKAIETHGSSMYDYSNVVYMSSGAKVTIMCNTCHELFQQIPASHLRGRGCPHCAGKTIDTRIFIHNAMLAHGKLRYDYSLVIYVGSLANVTIRCNRCMVLFEQSAKSHLSGRGCPPCGLLAAADARRSNADEFIARAIGMHGPTRYDYSSVVYCGSVTKVVIGCRRCGSTFKQAPTDHLGGRGCPRCVKSRGYSEAAICWLNSLSDAYPGGIQHAESGGEFTIPGTRNRADGYHAPTNTILEYHGCMWHGCPFCYPDRLAACPRSGKSYAVLYQDTLDKRSLIESLGYTYVCIWEHEWLSGFEDLEDLIDPRDEPHEEYHGTPPELWEEDPYEPYTPAPFNPSSEFLSPGQLYQHFAQIELPTP